MVRIFLRTFHNSCKEIQHSNPKLILSLDDFKKFRDQEKVGMSFRRCRKQEQKIIKIVEKVYEFNKETNSVTKNASIEIWWYHDWKRVTAHLKETGEGKKFLNW